MEKTQIIGNGLGYIKLHRQIIDSRLWSFSDATFRVAIYLLLSANHKPKFYRGINIERGQCIRSITRISDDCNVSRKAARHAIKVLSTDNFIFCDSPFGAQQGHRVTICKYEDYQDKEVDKGTRGAQQGHTRGTEGNTNKNDKNDKNDKNEEKNNLSCPDKPGDGGKVTKPRNLIMDALGALDGNIYELNQSSWKRVAFALKEIREVTPDVTQEEITQRAKNYKNHFPDVILSSTALAKHWARCGTGKAGQFPPLPGHKTKNMTSEQIEHYYLTGELP